MDLFARSATPKSARQPYLDHIANVAGLACRHARDALRYWQGGAAPKELAAIVENAAAFHDLGKLDEANQRVLSGKNPRASLPVKHQDAGVAHLMGRGEILQAMLVHAHHIGLPDMEFVLRQTPPMRVDNADERGHVDASLPSLLALHTEARAPAPAPSPFTSRMLAADLRILFSCLTDADHGDAASATGETTKVIPYSELRPTERLKALTAYVEKKARENKSDIPAQKQRNEIRDAFFNACLAPASENTPPLSLCDAPVGTGKTTSVMAHLLRVAEKRGLRRVFVVLPFTNIIQQSAEVYRKALVLPGESPGNVVAEIHHRADFEDRESRQLTALWNAPIVVTTAVAFFETFASNRPAALRRLHNVPGCAVFLDEAHAALPVNLLPLAWHWVKHTAQKWSCHWTLASGSLQHFWKLEEFAHVMPDIQPPADILAGGAPDMMGMAEKSRVKYRHKRDAMSVQGLVDWLDELEGPALVVLNTVHTAAATAKLAVEKFGENAVEHLSTSLSPADRAKTLDRVRQRLNEKEPAKQHWFLIATACVEAGVDISFRTGVRECASLASLLQLAGRVNRGAEFGQSEVWTIHLLSSDDHVTLNPAWTVSSSILRRFFEAGLEPSPELCTEAFKRELRERGGWDKLRELTDLEDVCSFKKIEEQFRVIEDETLTVVVDGALMTCIQDGGDVSWREIQDGSVRIRRRIVEKHKLQEARRYPGLYLWEYGYTPFLGYMEGVLALKKVDNDGGAII